MSNFAKQALNQLELIVHKPVARMRMICVAGGISMAERKKTTRRMLPCRALAVNG